MNKEARRDVAFPSATAEAFGAQVEVPEPAAALYLVVGRTPFGAHRAVREAGREVLSSLGDRRILALLAFREFVEVRAHPEVACAGGVTIDEERFARFAALVGLDSDENGERATGT